MTQPQLPFKLWTTTEVLSIACIVAFLVCVAVLVWQAFDDSRDRRYSVDYCFRPWEVALITAAVGLFTTISTTMYFITWGGN